MVDSIRVSAVGAAAASMRKAADSSRRWHKTAAVSMLRAAPGFIPVRCTLLRRPDDSGWRGDASDIIRRGLEYFTCLLPACDDGLFRTLVDSNGGWPLDERALLYDQAFALLRGYAAAADTLIAAAACFERRALALRSLIERRFAAEEGGFRCERGRRR